MSIYFCTDDSEDVWNPGSLTGILFHDQIESVARLLKVESGLGPIAADEVRLDRETFVAFAEAFSSMMLHTHTQSRVHSLVGGCFAIVLGLMHRLGAEPPTDPQVASFLAVGRRLVGDATDL